MEFCIWDGATFSMIQQWVGRERRYLDWNDAMLQSSYERFRKENSANAQSRKLKKRPGYWRNQRILLNRKILIMKLMIQLKVKNAVTISMLQIIE